MGDGLNFLFHSIKGTVDNLQKTRRKGRVVPDNCRKLLKGTPWILKCLLKLDINMRGEPTQSLTASSTSITIDKFLWVYNEL